MNTDPTPSEVITNVNRLGSISAAEDLPEASPEVASATATLLAYDQNRSYPDQVVELLARRSSERWAAWEAKAAQDPGYPAEYRPLVEAVRAIPGVCGKGKVAILRVLSEFRKLTTGSGFDPELKIPAVGSLLPLYCFVRLGEDGAVVYTTDQCSTGIRAKRARARSCLLDASTPGSRVATAAEVAEFLRTWPVQDVARVIQHCDREPPARGEVLGDSMDEMEEVGEA